MQAPSQASWFLNVRAHYAQDAAESEHAAHGIQDEDFREERPQTNSDDTPSQKPRRCVLRDASRDLDSPKPPADCVFIPREAVEAPALEIEPESTSALHGEGSQYSGTSDTTWDLPASDEHTNTSWESLMPVDLPLTSTTSDSVSWTQVLDIMMMMGKSYVKQFADEATMRVLYV
jgi:hypothetical protein